MTQGRDGALDGLRGIAAMFVVLSHVAAMTWVPFVDKRDPHLLEWGLWHLGAPAVDVFLVLSGYVVTRSLLRSPTGYFEFVVSRLARLYPVAWLGVCAGLALRHSGLDPLIGMTGAFRIGETLGVNDIMGLATMIAPIPDVDKVNPPLWTLVLETQAVLLLPVAALAARRWPLQVAAAGVLVPFIVSQAIGYAYPIFYTGFIIGAALAGAEHRIPKAPRPMVALTFFGGMLMCRHFLQSDDPLLRVPCAVAAAGLILCIRQGAARRLLEKRPVLWLGSVSYPLYAIHWPIMAAFTMAFGRMLGIVPAAVASIPVALAAAWLAERAVDRPAIAWSRLLRGR